MSIPGNLIVSVSAEVDPRVDAVFATASAALSRATDEVLTNLRDDSGRWLKLMADIEHETPPRDLMPFEDYDRARRISETGAFGSVPFNPPAGSIER
jgi:hypothetical protein